jgi:hypothetical protein
MARPMTRATETAFEAAEESRVPCELPEDTQPSVTPYVSAPSAFGSFTYNTASRKKVGQ